MILFDTTKANSQTHASLISFALHLDTVGGTKYSADYPFYLQKTLQEKYGDDFVSVFGIGTCGDINHVNVKDKHRLTTEEIGTMLSESVIKAIPELEPSAAPSLAIRQDVLHAPKQHYSPEQIRQAEQDIVHVGDRKVPFLSRVETYKILALQLHPDKTIPIEVQAIRLSPDVAIVTLPGEVFVELGMAIKQESPFKTTLVVELANAAPGYIPTRKAFAEGSYETVNSRVISGEGEKMVEMAIRLLKELGPESSK
ncbi:MAG: hypothetical protein KDA65_02110 [Planctomycetaceae bacterium]|nr:hypothetical protein [Planctomycetaceae bacterium]